MQAHTHGVSSRLPLAGRSSIYYLYRSHCLSLRRAEDKQFVPHFWKRRDVGNNLRQRFWINPGHEHGQVQWGHVNPYELEFE